MQSGLKIGLHGVSLPTEAELRALQSEFTSKHIVYLRSLVCPELLGFIARELSAADWAKIDQAGICTEERIVGGKLLTTLRFLFNHSDFLNTIQKIIGADLIRRFDGRVYCLRPNEGTEDDWHDDVGFNRFAAMSVIIGNYAFSGGKLEMRKRADKALIDSARPLQTGDAILFRVDPTLEHRVRPVTFGQRTAFAGWFQSQPDFWEQFPLQRSHTSFSISENVEASLN